LGRTAKLKLANLGNTPPNSDPFGRVWRMHDLYQRNGAKARR